MRIALQGVSEWFDDYLRGEQGGGLEQVMRGDVISMTEGLTFRQLWLTAVADSCRREPR